MDNDGWLKVVLSLLGIGLTITLTLIRLLFLSLKDRIDKNEEKADDLKDMMWKRHKDGRRD